MPNIIFEHITTDFIPSTFYYNKNVGGIFLNIKERTVPSKIIVLEAMNRRIDPSHETKNLVSSLLRRAEIGHRGEVKVDSLWKEINLPSTSLLFNCYETKNDFGNNHQMDTLFVCPHFILILEIKNVTGRIWYEKEKHQFMREKLNGEISSFQSPFDQVERHADLLERIVQRLGLSMPIHKAIVIAEPSTIIGDIPDEIPIFHAIGLPLEVKKLLLKYKHFSLSSAHFELLADQLQTQHKSSIYIPKFDIPPIRKGAICACGQLTTFKFGKFTCPCGKKSKEPLYQGLHDYRVLISEWISNRDFRTFFFIESEDAASKLLKRMNLSHEGSNRGRRYLIPEQIWKNR